MAIYNQRRVQNQLAIAQWKIGLPKVTVQHLLIMPILNDAWLSGFCDAEDSFHATDRTSEIMRGKIYFNYRYAFSIGQRGCKNKDAIYAI